MKEVCLKSVCKYEEIFGGCIFGFQSVNLATKQQMAVGLCFNLEESLLGIDEIIKVGASAIRLVGVLARALDSRLAGYVTVVIKASRRIT